MQADILLSLKDFFFIIGFSVHICMAKSTAVVSTAFSLKTEIEQMTKTLVTNLGFLSVYVSNI